MNLLVTGAAGFIGFHAARALAARGHLVTGADSMNRYYDPKLKKARLEILLRIPGFSFEKINLARRKSTRALFERGRFETVLHLAAQAGVRYSLENPHAYVDSNLQAFVNVLEGCRRTGVGHLVYASSSSVYGENLKLPFSERDRVDSPVSLYAATKKSNELMARAYNHLFGLPCTGLRFFTVYGPWGRPDMAMFRFAKAILSGKEIEVYNRGDMQRDFTYVDDVVEGITRIVEGRKSKVKGPRSKASGQDSGNPGAKALPDSFRIYNIGNSKPEQLMDLVRIIEEALGKKALRKFLPMQPGDVPRTCADTALLEKDYGFRPRTTLREGVRKFIRWYLEYYGR